MKNNKSPGSDEAIITEALKYSGDSLHAGSNKRSPTMLWKHHYSNLQEGFKTYERL